MFSGEKIKGSIVSLGMKTRNFFIYPDDELVIYALKGTTNIDLEQGEYFIDVGQAAFLPKGTAYRLSSKNDKAETKVLIIQSNKGKMFRLQPDIDQ
jgi:homogentisate 1,2-dioxygenase